MTGEVPSEYVLARRVLLDALDALGEHSAAAVLVGAQAIYLHTGDADISVAPMTTDADIVLAPDRLRDEPLLGDVLLDAGFILGQDPGSWRGSMGVAVDFMVPDALSGPGRRGAHLGPHGRRVARRSVGLEPALIDNTAMTIRSMDLSDHRQWSVRVAGPAALLIAKITKIVERRDEPARRQPKDSLDVLRLLQAVATDDLAGSIAQLLDSPLAAAVTNDAVTALGEHGTERAGLLASMVADAVVGVADPETLAGSLVILVEDLLRALPPDALSRKFAAGSDRPTSESGH